MSDPASSPAPALRVLIAEDQYMMREGARHLLEQAGLDVVGVACDYESVLEAARGLRPDAVLMDIKMPPTHTMEGIRAAHVIKQEQPGTGIVILSAHDEESYVWALLEKGVAGFGYLHKVRVGDVDQVVRAIREVASGGSVLDPRIVETMIRFRAKKPGSRLAELTHGELELLALMAEGWSNQKSAEKLFVSLGTVEKRAVAIFQKLGLSEEADVNRRVSAVLVYLRETRFTD